MHILTTPQPILDILAEMIAYDSSLDVRASAAPAGINLSDIPNVGLD
jgi:import receptor subunit TOM20